MSKLPETSRILLPSQRLVKSFLKPTWPTNADQDNLNIPAMDMEQRLNLILATGLSPGTRTIVNKNPFGVENTDRQGCQGARGPSLPLISAEGIVEDLEAALEQFREIAMDLRGERVEPEKR